MPIEDANKELLNVINPIGVIAGVRAGRKPTLAYLNENNNETTRNLVVAMLKADEAWIDYLQTTHSLSKESFLKKYDDKINELVLAEVQPNDNQSASK